MSLLVDSTHDTNTINLAGVKCCCSCCLGLNKSSLGSCFLVRPLWNAPLNVRADQTSPIIPIPEKKGTRGACSAFYGKAAIAMNTKHVCKPQTQVRAVLNTPTSTSVQGAEQAPTETKCTWLIHYVCSTTHLINRQLLNNSETLYLKKSIKLFTLQRVVLKVLLKKKKWPQGACFIQKGHEDKIQVWFITKTANDNIEEKKMKQWQLPSPFRAGSTWCHWIFICSIGSCWPKPLPRSMTSR